MSAIAFDTHEHIKAGMPEAVVNSQKALADSTLVTKGDLHAELTPIRHDLTMIKFTLGLLFVGIGAIFMKLFFLH
jgi:hypothetical protein